MYMENVEIKGKTFYKIDDFMKVYGVKSNKTVYRMVKDGRAIKDKYLSTVVFAINKE